MHEINLPQEEADYLFQIEKIKIDDKQWDLPDDFNSRATVPLISTNKKERFLLDITRRSINIQKQTFQTRAREAVVLARLDFGVTHRNPDKEEIGDPHLHLYREGFGDKWAIELPSEIFSNTRDKWQTLHDFMNFCNIVHFPNFRRGLFS
jgi:hypothetical protein